MKKINDLDDETEDGFVSRLKYRERLFAGLAILAMFLITVLDVIEDRQQGQDALNIAADLVYMGLMLAVLTYIWVLVPLSIRRRNRILVTEMSLNHADLQIWKSRTASLLAGLGQMVNEQFEQWQLSPAEKEVGLLLLKGFTIKQIAGLRETSDQTVRQQSISLYSKAGLSGRAELSAFFLEDLLLPTPG